LTFLPGGRLVRRIDGGKHGASDPSSAITGSRPVFALAFVLVIKWSPETGCVIE